MNQVTIQKFEAVFDKDQQSIKSFRQGAISSEDLGLIQRENGKLIAGYIKEYGFPFIDIASLKAYKAAFLSVQHSGDKSLLSETIEFFKAKNRDQIIKGDLAYLIDRLRILNNQPQLYGTQFRRGADGSIKFFDIEDEERLGERRKEMEMISFEEYKQMILGN